MSILRGRQVVLSIVIVSVFSTISQADVMVLDPGSTVEGKTIAEWTTDWTQWATSFSVPNDPFTDSTGAFANMNQSGPVFFIAGTLGGSAQRTFKVPTNTYLLLPMLNVSFSQAELGDFSLTETEIRDFVTGLVDEVDSLHASVDGVDIENLFDHREESPAFSYNAAVDNIFGAPSGNSGITVSDGYWLMIAPLAPGETHVINFGGGVSSFDFNVDVTATITAVPEPSTLVLTSLSILGASGLGWYRLRMRSRPATR